MSNKKFVILSVLVCSTLTAGAFEVVNKPYKKAPEPKLTLPIAAAPKVESQVVTEANSQFGDVKGVSAFPFQVREGDPFDEKVKEWLKKNNYALYWEAPQYLAGGTVTMNGSVESTLRDIIQMLQANGINITAEIYLNNAVRITEVK